MTGKTHCVTVSGTSALVMKEHDRQLIELNGSFAMDCSVSTFVTMCIQMFVDPALQ